MTLSHIIFCRRTCIRCLIEAVEESKSCFPTTVLPDISHSEAAIPGSIESPDESSSLDGVASPAVVMLCCLQISIVLFQRAQHGWPNLICELQLESAIDIYHRFSSVQPYSLGRAFLPDLSVDTPYVGVRSFENPT